MCKIFDINFGWIQIHLCQDVQCQVPQHHHELLPLFPFMWHCMVVKIELCLYLVEIWQPSACPVWTTEVAWGHAGSLIYRLNLATHCHMGHEWACYPVRQSASHLCPSLASLQSAATQWGHSSGLPVRHGFHFNINYSKNLAVFITNCNVLLAK